MFRQLASFLAMFFVISGVSAQVSCPAVVAGPDTTLSGPGCVLLRATPVSGFQPTSYTTQQIPYSPYPYNQGTGILLNIDDRWSSAITMPFNFCFYGNTYNQCVIGSNGVVSFDLTNAGGFNQWAINAGLPSNQNPMNAIYAPFHDIDPSIAGTIRWATYGTAPCRVFVVSFENCAMFSCNNLLATQQIVLYETTNIVETYIQNKPTCPGWNSGAAIHGIQNATGTAATVIPGRNFPTQWTATNDAWRFVPAGAPNFQVTWYLNGNPIANTDTVTVCPANCTIEYVSEVVYTNCNNTTVTVTDTATVIINNTQLSTNPVVVDNLCNGANTGSISLTPSGGINPYGYVWSSGDTTASINNLLAGVYTVVVTDSGGCVFFDTLTVNEPTAISTTVNANAPLCQGPNVGTATASASGGTPPYSYVWSNSQTGPNASNLTGGLYYVTVTDGNNCEAVDSVNLVVIPTPSVSIINTSDVSCNGGSDGTAQASATGGTPPLIMTWSNSQVGANATGLSAGNHYVVVTDAAGFCTDTAFFSISEPTALQASIVGNDVTCFGGNDGSAVMTVSGGTLPYTYNWNPFGGAQGTANGLPAGTYTCTVTDANGCTASQSVTLGTAVTLNSDFTFGNVCDGVPVVFADQTTGSTIVSWDWDFGDGNSSSVGAPSHTYAGPGTYTVSLVATSVEGCSDSIQYNVTIHPNPVADFSSTVACFGEASEFTDLSTIVSGSIVSWDWNFGGGNTSNIPDPSHVYSNFGTNPATLTVTSDQGCVGTVTLPVDVTPPPVIPAIYHDSVCQGFPAQLRVTVPAGMTVSWYYNSNSSTPFFRGNSYSTPPLENTVIYYLDVESANGCRTQKFPIWGFVYPPLQPGGLQVNSQELEIPNAVAEFGMSNPGNISSYLWNFGDGGSSSAATPVYEYSKPGEYDISISLTDIYGCNYEYFYDNHIKVIDNVRLFVPSAFSPNGDPENEYFLVSARLVDDFHIIIFDRWGKLIYESNDLNFKWDGTDGSGRPLPQGTFAWVINARTYLGEKVQKKGTISLLR